MPKAKSKSTSRSHPSQGIDDSDNDDVLATQTQASVSRSQQPNVAASELSARERDEIIHNVVRYLLIADQKKVPIKRADVIKHTMKDHSRAFNQLIKPACEQLSAVFGIEAVYDEKVKGFILVNSIDNMYDDPHQVWSPQDNANMGLVMVILSAIFMKGNKIDDDTLFDMLRRLGIDTENRDKTFGDVHRLVTTEFVRQGYLEIEREPGEPSRCIFRWGLRARLETTKQQALDFIGQVFGAANSERWASQLRDIEETEGQSSNM